MVYILFYSSSKNSKYPDGCPHCARFLHVLRKTDVFEYFQLIDVKKDVNGERHPAVEKFKIRYVPTVIANGRKFVGSAAVGWLKQIIQNKDNIYHDSLNRVDLGGAPTRGGPGDDMSSVQDLGVADTSGGFSAWDETPQNDLFDDVNDPIEEKYQTKREASANMAAELERVQNQREAFEKALLDRKRVMSRG